MQVDKQHAMNLFCNVVDKGQAAWEHGYLAVVVGVLILIYKSSKEVKD